MLRPEISADPVADVSIVAQRRALDLAVGLGPLKPVIACLAKGHRAGSRLAGAYLRLRRAGEHLPEHVAGFGGGEVTVQASPVSGNPSDRASLRAFARVLHPGGPESALVAPVGVPDQRMRRGALAPVPLTWRCPVARLACRVCIRGSGGLVVESEIRPPCSLRVPKSAKRTGRAGTNAPKRAIILWPLRLSSIEPRSRWLRQPWGFESLRPHWLVCRGSSIFGGPWDGVGRACSRVTRVLQK